MVSTYRRPIVTPPLLMGVILEKQVTISPLKKHANTHLKYSDLHI